MFFVSLQKLFSFSRKSYFRILAIQISWRYQMPNHKTRNTFCWITWEVNTVFQWNLASLCHITKENNLLENSAKIAAWKLVPDPFAIFKASSLHEICNSRAIKIYPNQLADLVRFLFTEVSLKINKGLELVSRSHFSYNFLIKIFLL